MMSRIELDNLKNGTLIGKKELRLTNLGLTEFPTEVFSLAESLELLDLSGNKLSLIPDEITKLKKLKIAFFSFNQFETFPKILSQLPDLEMIGFKSNQINYIPENAFPEKLRWLILTQNKISELPASIGSKNRLQKLMLAGNKLKTLPNELKNCRNLELLRISANQFEQVPRWIFEMPKLTWLAYGANNFNFNNTTYSINNSYDFKDFEIKEILGEGASGIISKAIYMPTNEQVAIKMFKGEITSDGLPESEMQAAINASFHPNLIKIRGIITNHPEAKMGLVLDLIPKSFKNLGFPPNLETCTRDVFSKDVKYTIDEIIKIVCQVAEICEHFHKNNLMHGDLYAHNILINNQKHVFLSDFGAATIYENSNKINEKLEIRAWACLLDDLLENCYKSEAKNIKTEQFLVDLKNKCLNEKVSQRPDFEEVLNRLKEKNFD